MANSGPANLLTDLHVKLDGLIARLDQPPQRFLSVKSAASYADLSEDSIRRLIERGDLVGRRPVEGRAGGVRAAG
jgi:hypothetical protein